MKGGYYFRKDRNRWIVWWPADGKKVLISRYKGRLMHKTHPKDNPKLDHGLHCAQKLLNLIQADYELYTQGEGSFRIEKYTEAGYTDLFEFFSEWMNEVIAPVRAPATVKGYWSYYRTWFEPFFTAHPALLHEIQLDTLNRLRNFITTEPKTKYNIMNCLHSMMVYAWRSRRIPEVPPFPRKEEYGLKKPEFKALSTKERAAAFAKIPEHHKPIFMWLMLHFRRIGEACALHKIDYDPINGKFRVWRGISDRKLINKTKTGEIYHPVCHPSFVPVANWLLNQHPESPFLFVNPTARKDGKRYTDEALNRIWRTATKAAGIRTMKLYNVVRHSSCFEAVENGLPIEDLMILTEHKDRRAAQHYYEVSNSRQSEIQRRAGVNCEWEPKLVSGRKG